MFPSTVQAYIDMKGLSGGVQQAEKEEDLNGLLPEHFFRTAHHISPEVRVQIQGIVQRSIDHSISSTVNLPESIDPEVISNVYLQAWKKNLKGITIYRDGSRYPILSVAQQISDFQIVKDKEFIVEIAGRKMKLKGDEVFTLPNGTLSTPFHAKRTGAAGVKITEVSSEEKPLVVGGDDDIEKPKGACKVEFKDGHLVKDCGG